MSTAVQLDVIVGNVPGTLAALSDKLRAADVNINAISCTEGPRSNCLHLIVDDTETAKIVLKQHYPLTTTDVLAFKMKNKPGAIAAIARACAAASINIRNMYATTFGREATVYVVVDDLEKAKAHLAQWRKSFGSIAG